MNTQQQKEEDLNNTTTTTRPEENINQKQAEDKKTKQKTKQYNKLLRSGRCSTYASFRRGEF